MISGITPNGGYPWPFVTKVQPVQTPQTAPAAEVQNEKPPPADAIQLSPPSGDQATLAREFTLFDLASREYSRILPKIEAANVAVD